MTITVFGANGAIGKLLISKALENGYNVKASVRNPQKINITNANLEVIKGELSDFDLIKKVISDSDAVISTLGCPMKWTYPRMDVLEGHVHIIKAMQELKISRFISLATPSVKFEEDKRSVITILPEILAGLIFRKAKKEIIAIGKEITESNLDWTIVRILAPKNLEEVENIKVTFGEQKINFAIPRSNIARFMLEQVEYAKYIHSMPIIGT